MTDYHPVTKEELEQIRSGCDATKMMDEVLSRPDPLALLEVWREWRSLNRTCYETKDYPLWGEETKIIKQLRTNPEAVLKELKEKDVWK